MAELGEFCNNSRLDAKDPSTLVFLDALRVRFRIIFSEVFIVHITILNSKIHRARVTSADKHYEGSISIDANLMKAADLVHHQHVHVWNVTTGSRFETYAIPAPKSSGMIQINGAAAHHAKKGDLVIISSFAHIPRAKAKSHKPKVVFVDDKNRVKKITRMSGSPVPQTKQRSWQ